MIKGPLIIKAMDWQNERLTAHSAIHIWVFQLLIYSNQMGFFVSGYNSCRQAPIRSIECGGLKQQICAQ